MLTLEPTSNKFKVPRPNFQCSEFEIQARLFSGLKELGLDVRGEVKTMFGDRRSTCRFDLVLYDEAGHATQILEVKASDVRHKSSVEATRQGQRYTQFGVPVTFIYGMPDALAFIAKIGGPY